jgi:hypothetical protein
MFFLILLKCTSWSDYRHSVNEPSLNPSFPTSIYRDLIGEFSNSFEAPVALEIRFKILEILHRSKTKNGYLWYNQARFF